MAEFNELTVPAAMSPGRIVRRDAAYQLSDRDGRARSPGTSAAGKVPFAADQAPVPGEQRRRGHGERPARRRRGYGGTVRRATTGLSAGSSVG